MLEAVEEAEGTAMLKVTVNHKPVNGEVIRVMAAAPACKALEDSVSNKVTAKEVAAAVEATTNPAEIIIPAVAEAITVLKELIITVVEWEEDQAIVTVVVVEEVEAMVELVVIPVVAAADMEVEEDSVEIPAIAEATAALEVMAVAEAVTEVKTFILCAYKKLL